MRRKDLMRDATVMSASPEEFREPIFRFAADLCHTERLDLILHPNMDCALIDMDLDIRGITKQKRFEVLEIVKARVIECARYGSTTCVIVPHVVYNRDDPRFDTCVQLAYMERELIASWGRFRRIYTACLTPEGEIVQVGE
jgi:hypothetical protein